MGFGAGARLTVLAGIAACGRSGFSTADGSATDVSVTDVSDAAALCEGSVTYDSVGDGSPSAPYLICNAAQWIDISANPASWSAHFRLAANIDLSSVSPPHPEIGTYVPAVPFTGVMDGDRHVILNFTNADSRTYFGLFGNVDGAQAEIKNIALVNPQLWIGPQSGGLVGYLAQGTVRNAAVLGSSCYVRSMAYANHHGSLVGETRPGSMVIDVFSNCELSGNGGGVGGLVGHNEGSITNCYHKRPAVITDTNGNYVGGLVGWNTGAGSVANCFADTDVHGNNPGTVGLLVGAGTAPTNSYFASNRTCTNDGGPCNSYGTGIDLVSTPEYFHRQTNPPCTSWDFSTTWAERSGAEPVLAWLVPY